MILADTSVWVEYLRAGPSPEGPSENHSLCDELDELISQQQILTCGPVLAELLAGARGPQREELERQLSAQPWIDLKHADWLTVGRIAAKLQRRGQTIPLLDVQIAVCAVKGEAQLWTLDRDFERIAQDLEGLNVRIFQ